MSYDVWLYPCVWEDHLSLHGKSDPLTASIPNKVTCPHIPYQMKVVLFLYPTNFNNSLISFQSIDRKIISLECVERDL